MTTEQPQQQKPTKLSYGERRELRMQQRVEKWEARRAGPPPPRRIHRAIVTLLMLGMMLALLALLVTGPGGTPPA